MGNLPSLFRPSESTSQCIVKDSFVVLHPSSIDVMLTPAEGRFPTNDLPQAHHPGRQVRRLSVLAARQDFGQSRQSELSLRQVSNADFAAVKTTEYSIDRSGI
jgi:hypothetical protein